MRLALCLTAALAGCTTGMECEDTDLDGYGPSCALGDDCDPNDASRNYDCEIQPPPDCDADPRATGCPCLAGARAACLDERAGVGICVGGGTMCINGFWGLCDGGVPPQSERCDGHDEDCDGLVDEGVVSPCGGCTPGCLGGVWGEGAVPFTASPGLELTRFGELTLGTERRTTGEMWVANSAEGTLSRIDIHEQRETARYPSGGTEPSRVAVDWHGDAWIVNREFDGMSSVTKVAGDPSRCVDVDGDGLETSTGPSDVRLLAEDECILFNVPVGGHKDVARAIAIDGDTGLDDISGGDAWIGLHDGHAVIELDGLTGAELRRIETPEFSPYSATFDRWGVLWMAERQGLVARIDPHAAEPLSILTVPYPCYLLYSLSVDQEGRLLLTGFSCDALFSYDPALDRWSRASSPPSPRGSMFDPDVGFVTAHTSGLMSRVRLDPLRASDTFEIVSDTVTPFETIGIAIDADGMVWTASSQGGAGDDGIATRIDPESGEVLAQVEVGRAPHVQGDLAGARVRYALVPEASQSHVFEGCGPDVPTEWVRVHVAGTFGNGGTVRVEARHAADRAALASASYAVLGTVPTDPSPFALSVPDGGVIEVDVTLAAEGASGAPRLRRIGVEWRCPGPD